MVFVKKVVKRSFKHNALIVANIYIFIDNTNNKKTFSNINSRLSPLISVLTNINVLKTGGGNFCASEIPSLYY